MGYRAVIFDLDGVICHTDRYHYQAWKELADGCGIYFDEEINSRLRGISRMDSLEIILERSSRTYTPEEKLALTQRKNERYGKLLEDMTAEELSPQVWETLQVLRGRGYLLAIGSSSKNAKLILKQLGLETFFDAISDGCSITRSKPDPEVFINAAARLGLAPEACLVVEDARAGIEAAYAGGFDSAGLGDEAGDERVTYPLTCFGDLTGIL